MTITHTSALPASTIGRAGIASPAKVALRILNWLVKTDQAYRDRQHLKSLSEPQLKDVGLTRWMIG